MLTSTEKYSLIWLDACSVPAAQATWRARNASIANAHHELQQRLDSNVRVVLHQLLSRQQPCHQHLHHSVAPGEAYVPEVGAALARSETRAWSQTRARPKSAALHNCQPGTKLASTSAIRAPAAAALGPTAPEKLATLPPCEPSRSMKEARKLTKHSNAGAPECSHAGGVCTHAAVPHKLMHGARMQPRQLRIAKRVVTFAQLQPKYLQAHLAVKKRHDRRVETDERRLEICARCAEASSAGSVGRADQTHPHLAHRDTTAAGSPGLAHVRALAHPTTCACRRHSVSGGGSSLRLLPSAQQ